MRNMKLWTLLSMLVFNIAQANVDLVKVDKSERKMYLLDGNRVVKEYRISLGANPRGHKQREGDRRTPEGIYTLDYAKEDSIFYRAMHISYPNETDIRRARARGIDPGGFIMVHGQRTKPRAWRVSNRKRDWTHGCIAITNSEMDEFMELVDVGTKIQIEW